MHQYSSFLLLEPPYSKIVFPPIFLKSMKFLALLPLMLRLCCMLNFLAARFKDVSTISYWGTPYYTTWICQTAVLDTKVDFWEIFRLSQFWLQVTTLLIHYFTKYLIQNKLLSQLFSNPTPSMKIFFKKLPV